MVACGGGRGAALPSLAAVDTNVPDSRHGVVKATPTPTPSPTATPKTTASPTPAPTATPATTTTSSTTGIVNGQEWPTTFVPYGGSRIWNSTLPDSGAALLANSAGIVQNAQSSTNGPAVHTQEYSGSGGYDVSHPVVVATTSDPLVKTSCYIYCNGTTAPASVYIPAAARPAGGSDHHLAVVQPDGTEVDFWEVSQNSTQGGSVARNWQSGDTLDFGSGASCGNFSSGSGETTNGATAGGGCLGAGLVRAAELNAGNIAHALFVGTNCVANYYVYPATQTAQVCTDSSLPNVPLGARIQVIDTAAQIQAMPLQPWEKTILIALHTYGGYIMDTGGSAPSTVGLVDVEIEDDAQFAAFGTTVTPMQSYGAANGWTPVSVNGATRYIAASPWNPFSGSGGWAAHLQIVSSCYAQGTC